MQPSRPLFSLGLPASSADAPLGRRAAGLGLAFVLVGGGASVASAAVDLDTGDLVPALSTPGNQPVGGALVVGDFDGDGRDDVAVGLPGIDEVWVFRNDPNDLDWFNILAVDVTITGIDGSDLGTSLLALPYDDGTPRDLLLIGAPADTSGAAGAVLAFDLRTNLGRESNLGVEDALLIATLSQAGDRLGTALARASSGDTGDKGILVVGAPGADVDFEGAGGAVYLVDEATFTTNSLQGATVWISSEAGAELGTALAVGDLDGNGTPEIIAGAPGTSAGTFYVAQPPRSSGSGYIDDLAARWDGDEAGGGLGTSLVLTPPLSYGADGGRESAGVNLLVSSPGTALGGDVRLVLGGGVVEVGKPLANATLLHVNGGGASLKLGASLAWTGGFGGLSATGFAVGAPSASFDGCSGCGAVFFVPATGLDTSASVRSIADVAPLVLKGHTSAAAAGSSLLAAPYDGRDGLLIGAPSLAGRASTCRVTWATSAVLEADDDQDGVTVAEGDCDDGNNAVYPSATEVCDGLDNNCDGLADEGGSVTVYLDDDRDGYGAGDATVLGGCDVPVGYSVASGDCDDTDPSTSPGASEVCDGADNNCDGQRDEGLSSATYHPDADDDGYGDQGTSEFTCDPDPSWILVGGDCDDTKADVHPNATETCDQEDDDCDGDIDEGLSDAKDNDEDGYTTCEGDCDDTDPDTHPGATEVCDLADNNCDGTSDEGFDADGDGHPSPQLCPDLGDDCDDGAADTYPGATEICADGDDNNCDGTVDDPGTCGESPDADQDGYTIAQGDCDDTNPSVYLGAFERCDGLDNNCDGSLGETEIDVDEDGSLTCKGTLDADCNDADATIYPGAPELCDGLDNNCDSSLGSTEIDRDRDGFYECQECEDRDDEVYPDAPELCDAKDNNCDGDIDEGLDGDGDGALPVACGGTDCDDTNGDIGPGEAEVLGDGVDEDCDGVASDQDGDGWCSSPDEDAACAAEADCDDTVRGVNPGALDVPEDGIDQDCSGADAEATPTEPPPTPEPTPVPPVVIGPPGIGGGDGVDGIAFACDASGGSQAPWAGLLIGLLGLGLRRRSAR